MYQVSNQILKIKKVGSGGLKHQYYFWQVPCGRSFHAMRFLCEYNLPLNSTDVHRLSLKLDNEMCAKRWTFYNKTCIQLKKTLMNEIVGNYTTVGRSLLTQPLLKNISSELIF